MILAGWERMAIPQIKSIEYPRTDSRAAHALVATRIDLRVAPELEGDDVSAAAPRPSFGVGRADSGHGRGAAAASNTIVVVDDEEAICEAVKDVLEERGYVVEVAGNGVHGMAIVNLMASRPRLVILDLSMPWMDGNAMLAALKSDPALSSIPVIISTADPSRVPHGVPVMKKPIDFNLLLEAIRASF
jgi:CheY-like chemotaxis protein